MAATVARMVYYSGQVQGVGFRATTVHLAQGYAVNGWVRNMADGRVQLWAEGSAEVVDAFLQAVRIYWHDYLSGEECREQAVNGRLSGFTITR
jgi:acylphosphatase